MQWRASAWQLKLSVQLSTAAYNILNKLLGSHRYVTLTIIKHHQLKKHCVCHFHTRRQTQTSPVATHAFLLSQSQQIQFKLHIGYYLIRPDTTAFALTSLRIKTTHLHTSAHVHLYTVSLIQVNNYYKCIYTWLYVQHPLKLKYVLHHFHILLRLTAHASQALQTSARDNASKFSSFIKPQAVYRLILQIPDSVMLFLQSNQLAEYPFTGVKQSNRRWFDVDLLCRIQGKVSRIFIYGGKIKHVLVFFKR